MGARRPMNEPDDRRDPDRQIFRDLYAAIDGLEQRFHDLKPLLENVAVLASRVTTNASEIDRLRIKVDRLSEDLAGLIARLKDSKKERGSISPSWVAVVLSIIGIVLTAMFKIVEWIKDRP